MTTEPGDKRDDEGNDEPVEIPVETGEEAPEEPAAESAEQLTERLMRLQAEFENFRKRSVRERAEWGARAKETLVLDLLPVVDSFDRALGEAAGSPSLSLDEAGLQGGMMLVHKQLLSALAGQGVTPIEALGEPFDPNLHEAFMSRPAEEGETPGTIVTEFATGYRMGDRVIRPTKGVVAGEPESDSEPEVGSEEE
ncbi:MAG: nucleotide exchange factor GrpE [Planctomycetota bacterium]